MSKRVDTVSDTPAALTLLLPARTRLGGDLSTLPALARMLARADREQAGEGDEAQLQRHFDVLPRGLSIAALTRQLDCNDAQHNCWLRADPAHVRADLGAGRMLACGELGLTRDEADELVAPLRPLFGDDNAPISVGAPSRWYLMLPREAKLPAFSPPERVLGDDIYAHLPEGDAGRRWRRLLNEAQVILHNHPVNATRARSGKPSVNSLWFWGGGALPDSVRTTHSAVHSGEAVLLALSRVANVKVGAARSFQQLDLPAGALVDLSALRDLATLERDWIEPALAAQRGRRIGAVVLDFADGLQYRHQRGHRWRFWRSNLRSLA